MLHTELISNAWNQAAEDLGIEVIAPFLVELPHGGSRQFHALVKSFGTFKGTLIGVYSESGADTFWNDSAIAEQAGYYFSQLNPTLYGAYDRELFIDTLFDWGWADAENKPPNWYRQRVCR